MEKTLSEILENQLKFKDQILEYFLLEYAKTTKKLRTMKTQSEYIETEKEKLLKKYNSKKATKSVQAYFAEGLADYDKIMGRIKEKNKTKQYVVLWNEETKEAEVVKFNEKQNSIKDEKNQTTNDTGIN